ncbi:MAG TPA: cupin domain-containing protein [Pyrinomonadaceae bacterium]|nr:cupin domain-containing protein [Pyrinomonadaceae bacterium]
MEAEINSLAGEGFRLEMIMPADAPREALLSKGSAWVRVVQSLEGSNVTTLAPQDLRDACKDGDRQDSPPSEGGVDAASADGVVLSPQPTEIRVGEDQENHPALAKPRAPLLRKEGSFVVASLPVLEVGDASAKEVVHHNLDTLQTQVWIPGRAGMEYRDLIPGRLHGFLIASHIRLTQGGEVPDYVHYHKLLFQMIYCRAGWVRVVYEDQGEPFVMNAGDCVLQPPGIRHRVLESSAGAEVIELSSPAEHETWVEHELTLPNAHGTADRRFAGQSFVRHVAAAAGWESHSTFESRNIGIADATDRLADVCVMRVSKLTALESAKDHTCFIFILHGEVAVDGQPDVLTADDCAIVPAGKDPTTNLVALPGAEILKVTLSPELAQALVTSVTTCREP